MRPRKPERDAQIVAMAGSGRTRADVARHFGVSVRTVDVAIGRAKHGEPVQAKVAGEMLAPYVGVIVRPREPFHVRPLRLPAALQASAARAAAHQPRLICCSSRVPDGGAS